MTIRRAVTVALASALLVTGCATMRSGAPSVPLKIVTAAPDATVWIDDRLVGRAADFAKGDKRLVLGFHRIEVRAPGYYSHFQEVEPRPDTPLTITAPLHPHLD